MNKKTENLDNEISVMNPSKYIPLPKKKQKAQLHFETYLFACDYSYGKW